MLYSRWVILQIKLHMRSVSFWIFIAAAALILFLSKNYRNNPDKTILLQSGLGDVQEAVCEAILNDSLPGYSFLREDSEDEIKRKVRNGEAVCGVCFDGDMDDAAEELEMVVYATPKTLDGMIIQEVVFPYLLRVQSSDMLRDYLESKGTSDSSVEGILKINQEYLEKGNISIFTVQEEKTAVGRVSAAWFNLREFLIVFLGAVMVIWYGISVMREKLPVYRAVRAADVTRLKMVSAAARITVSLAVLFVINFILIKI